MPSVVVGPISRIQELFLAHLEHIYLFAILLVSILFIVRLVVHWRKKGIPGPFAFAWIVIQESVSCFIMALALIVLAKLFLLALSSLARLFHETSSQSATGMHDRVPGLADIG